jgi:hypothetical protein
LNIRVVVTGSNSMVAVGRRGGVPVGSNVVGSTTRPTSCAPQLEPMGGLEVDALGKRPVPVPPRLLEHAFDGSVRRRLEQERPEPAQRIEHRKHLVTGPRREFVDGGRGRRRQHPPHHDAVLLQNARAT